MPELICVDNKEKFDQLKRVVAKASIVALDTEHNSLNMYIDDFVLAGICVAVDVETGYYVPTGHAVPDEAPLFAHMVEQLEESDVLTWVAALLKTKKIIYHNAAHDVQVLRRVGLDPPQAYFDTQVAASLLRDPRGRIGLKYWAEKLTGQKQLTIEEVTGGHPEQIMYLHPEEATPYAAADAVNSMILYEYFKEKLPATSGMIEKIFWDIEMPITMVSAQMQQCGIVLNKDKIKDIARRSKKLVVRSKAGVELILGKEINLASGPAKLRLIYGEMGYPIQKNQGGHQEYVADTKMIKRLLRTQPKKKAWRDGAGEKVLNLLIEHSRGAKILSTYTQSLIDLTTPDGRLHGSFNAVGPLSGRVSSSGPNMQNLPTDTDLDVRDAMEAPEGFTFTIADYKAIEMRIMAALSQDPNMVQAVTDPLLDIHKLTAHHAYGIPYDPHSGIDEITPTQRKNAKGVGFGIAYGRSPFELAVDLGITIEEANQLIQDGFYAAYPKVLQLFEVAEKFARHRGYATTHLGRRRTFCTGPMPDAYELAVKRRCSRKEAIALLATWGRQTRNHFAQGGAADIVKAAMIRVYNELPSIDVEAMISAQVHDEILTMHRIEHTKAIQEMMIEQMVCELRGIRLDVDLYTYHTLTKNKDKRKNV